MEFFPNEAHVRLRSCGDGGTYLHANEDGVHVSLRPHHASLNTAWRVHQIRRDGSTYVLLQGAAYGRYLAQSALPPPPGYTGRAAVQVTYDDPEQSDVVWEAFRVQDGAGDVLIRHLNNLCLRANPVTPLWHTGVLVDDFNSQGTTTHWMVEEIPPGPDPSMFLNPKSTQIRYVRADEMDNYGNSDPDPEAWKVYWFVGRSVFYLRRELAVLLGEMNHNNIRLAVRAGSQGRLTPLVADLPSSVETFEIVVLTTGSPAASRLVYPNVDAPGIRKQDL